MDRNKKIADLKKQIRQLEKGKKPSFKDKVKRTASALGNSTKQVFSALGEATDEVFGGMVEENSAFEDVENTIRRLPQ